ncbi:MAG: Peptide deformylase 2 [candidate division WS2 bacterium]|nr:Peptide deformylase 2 [Candidatus Psychracetigena formicireducens]MBT9150381.1 Peptide deformylase 2 [Candidatus Psychracetigena formicireducens]
MVREIINSGNPILRTVSKEVSRITPEIHILIKDMIDTLKASPIKGVGLAAPQVGVNLRVVIILLKDTKSENIIPLINPQIVSFRGEEEEYEGCLCLPRLYGKVKRHQEVKLKALNEKGEPFVMDLKGLSARVIQHEIDHLDGILFMDRMEDPTQLYYEDLPNLFPTYK